MRDTSRLKLSLAMIVYFLKGKRLPRLLVLGAVVGAMFAIPATEEYRKSSVEDPLEALAQIDFSQQFI